jgi:hypothetical protein
MHLCDSSAKKLRFLRVLWTLGGGMGMAIWPLKEGNNEHVCHINIINYHVSFTTKSMCVKVVVRTKTWKLKGVCNEHISLAECWVAPLWVETRFDDSPLNVSRLPTFCDIRHKTLKTLNDCFASTLLQTSLY